MSDDDGRIISGNPDDSNNIGETIEIGDENSSAGSNIQTDQED